MALATETRPEDETPALPAAPQDLRLDVNRRGSMVLGVMLAVAADLMALAGLLGAYLALRSLRHPFPPDGFKLPTYLPAMITVTAVMLSFSVAWALWAVRRNDRKSAVSALVLSVLLGVAMLNGQWYAMTHAKLNVAEHPYDTIVLCLYGFALVHAAAALVGLAAVLGRTVGGQLTAENDEPAEAGAWVAHLATGVWGVIFLTVYLLAKT